MRGIRTSHWHICPKRPPGTNVKLEAVQPTADRATRTGKGLAEGQSEASPLSARPLSVGLVKLRAAIDGRYEEARREHAQFPARTHPIQNGFYHGEKAALDWLRRWLESEEQRSPAESR